MAKKRLGKSAKAALKLLNDSKQLATKNANDTKADPNFKQTDVAPRTSTANKLRPEKKRG